MTPTARALLVLEDGRLFEGEAFGALGLIGGEVVFNTSMTGYQEILTDPSYHGQFVVMTCPQIGNYGVNSADEQSSRTHVRGFVAREFSRTASSHTAEEDLAAYLTRHGIVGIHRLDTRALTRHIRERGALRGVIASGPALAEVSGPDALVSAARAVPDMSTLDAVSSVTTPRRYEWKGSDNPKPESQGYRGPTLAVLDLGVKREILRNLAATGARIVVLPASTAPEEILSLGADGLFLSNGPGDPRMASAAVETVRELLGRLPVAGICLGHQILALAAGAETFKLPFGHHGGNHPVRDCRTGRIDITAQNHNYAVEEASALDRGFTITHTNLNDGTVEGMFHEKLGVFSVQYHPEGAPGPHDSSRLWPEFMTALSAGTR
ncbi:MAG: glutamine-hydrolyzing carbamoyl-phosphate synthase small subunit [Gemmatimonadota bacterium]|nr:glutamine-hydrolyzing carbamoyl-phosphate synthase small subunit [Gemmatimonadota bacterium]MDP6803519.1 glutamine-hydrolyzing carbamoyl-phosphate synthase small subunit [Gemmatimonadota bacterium]